MIDSMLDMAVTIGAPAAHEAFGQEVLRWCARVGGGLFLLGLGAGVASQLGRTRPSHPTAASPRPVEHRTPVPLERRHYAQT